MTSCGASVAVVPGRYCVSYLILGPRFVVVVDVGSIADVPDILNTLKDLGRATDQVRYVIPSHLHFDHVMGIETLCRETGASVALTRSAHEALESRTTLRYPTARRDGLYLLGGWVMQGMPLPVSRDLREGRAFGFPNSANPFSRLGLVLNGGCRIPGIPGWVVLETPGHADDALALFHRKSGYLVTGDTVRNFLGGEWNPVQVDPNAFRETASRLKSLPVRAVFPGHGPVLEGPDVLDRLRVI
jgi:glyoxylase-like metal-dependent hydrolase (beta-lactamase superfamily II)